MNGGKQTQKAKCSGTIPLPPRARCGPGTVKYGDVAGGGEDIVVPELSEAGVKRMDWLKAHTAVLNPVLGKLGTKMR